MKISQLCILALLSIGMILGGCNFPVYNQGSTQEEIVVIPSETPTITSRPTATDTSIPTSPPLATYTPTKEPSAEPSMTPRPPQDSGLPISIENFDLLQMTILKEIDNLRDVAWLENPVPSLAFLSESNVSFIASEDASPILQVDLPEEYYVFDISPIGNLIACTDDYERILLLSATNLEQRAVINPETFIANVHFDATGTRLIITSMEQMVAIEADALTGEIIKIHSGFSTAAPVYDAVFSRYTNDIIWYARGRIQLQNPINDRLSSDFRHEDWVNAFSISPDGEFLAVATAKSTSDGYSPGIQLWHTSTGEALSFIQTDNIASDLFYSADGSLLIANDGVVLKFWDTSTGELLKEMTGHIDAIYAVSLSPNGEKILTASTDGQVILWHLP